MQVRELLWTLANCPHLARYVKKLGMYFIVVISAKLSHSNLLELRDFPKNLTSSEREDLFELCIRGIANCTSLSSCSWTRDGSLNTVILRTLQQNTHLRELEINGHHNYYYDPLTLANFTGLRKISLIMPSGDVIKMLPSWLESTGDTLRVLSLVCKSAAQVTDTLLSSIAGNLQNLEELHLAGCPKVTHKGVSAILEANNTRIRALALEGLSASFVSLSYSKTSIALLKYKRI